MSLQSVTAFLTPNSVTPTSAFSTSPLTLVDEATVSGGLGALALDRH